jgi:peptidyl-tRNA hydrolase
MSKVTRFPVHGRKRAANRRGKRSVSCTVSERFLRFEEGINSSNEGTQVIMRVMTDASGEERTLTTLVITLEQLREVLKLYE